MSVILPFFPELFNLCSNLEVEAEEYNLPPPYLPLLLVQNEAKETNYREHKFGETPESNITINNFKNIPVMCCKIIFILVRTVAQQSLFYPKTNFTSYLYFLKVSVYLGESLRVYINSQWIF